VQTLGKANQLVAAGMGQKGKQIDPSDISWWEMGLLSPEDRQGQ